MQSRPVRASRRSFIKGLAVTTGGLVVPRVFWAQEGGPANRKLGIAAIGCGGKGESDLNAAARGNNVVAICDVDSRSLAKAAARYPGAKQYADFRQMLDEVKEIDAVTISTSDHAHFPAAMHAIALGKHVCVQKPLANTLWELREMHLAATKKGVITQMGNQGHTYNANRMLKEWLDAGVVGKVKEIHVWTNRPIWPQGKAAGFKPDDVPDYLNWPLWLAQCPDMPYSPEIHPFKWRGYLEFGGGAIGDMGCHLMDPIFYALDLGIPRYAEAATEELTDVAWPRGGVVKLTWKNHAKLGDVTMTWYEGKDAAGKQHLPPVPPELGDNRLGDECKNPLIFPEERRKDFLSKPIEQKYPRSPKAGEPQEEWTLAIKEGKVFDFMSKFDYAAPLTELGLLGGLAMRVGQPIEWDSAKLEVVGVPDAARFIKRAAYRKGWEYSAAKI
jgi:predicted dehydrogenase